MRPPLLRAQMPKLASESGRVFVAAHVDKDISQRLDALAASYGMSKAAVIRLALHYALEQPIDPLHESILRGPPQER